MSQGKLNHWKCGCEEFQLEVSGTWMFKCIECYCDDCRVRTLVMQDRETEKGHKHGFTPTGGMAETNVGHYMLKFIKGREHVGFFRAALVRDGTAWDRSRMTLNMYAKCCNSLVLHIADKHPWGIEIQSRGFTDFKPIYAADGGSVDGLFGTGDGRRGPLLPKEIKIKDGFPSRMSCGLIVDVCSTAAGYGRCETVAG